MQSCRIVTINLSGNCCNCFYILGTAAYFLSCCPTQVLGAFLEWLASDKKKKKWSKQIKSLFKRQLTKKSQSTCMLVRSSSYVTTNMSLLIATCCLQMWTQGVQIAHLLQLRVNTVPGSSAGTAPKDEGEEFRCLVLKPFYLQPRFPSPGPETGTVVHT